eukprot:TRINITY_DN35727_c0_g1_i1.p2 TRINITY_DN35727_c0_g1~~TRINITY_DN35727_c0_g1_i1.p2  ORF type:complete len:290 (-),score=9.43 TRINITY_DN35727_c0_g1_i1:315-1184(-)
MNNCHKYISFSIYCPHEGNLELISCDITEFKDIIELKRISMYFSARFINTPTEKINEEINNALYEIKHFYGAECCCIFQYDKDSNTFSCSNQCIMEWKEIPRIYQQIKLDDFEWLLDRIKNDEIVNISNSDELPEEAFKEKEYFKHLGYKSMVFLPIIYEGKVLGIFGLATLNYEKIWTSEQIDLLKIICTPMYSGINAEYMGVHIIFNRSICSDVQIFSQFNVAKPKMPRTLPSYMIGKNTIDLQPKCLKYSFSLKASSGNSSELEIFTISSFLIRSSSHSKSSSFIC